jgi:hypothetical protein
MIACIPFQNDKNPKLFKNKTPLKKKFLLWVHYGSHFQQILVILTSEENKKPSGIVS